MNIKIDTNNCRVCLQSAGKGQPLFAEATQFAHKYSYCTQLTATKDDGLPELICSKCIARLKIAYEFRKQSLSTEQHLRKFLAALNSKPVDQDADDDDAAELDDAAYEARLLAEAEAEELAAAAEATEPPAESAKPVPAIPSIDPRMLAAIKQERSVSLKRPASMPEPEQDPLPSSAAAAAASVAPVQRLHALKVEPELLIIAGSPGSAQDPVPANSDEPMAAVDDELVASDNDLYHVVVQEVEVAQDFVYEVELADGEGTQIVREEDMMNEEHLLEEEDDDHELLMIEGAEVAEEEEDDEEEDDSYSVAESLLKPPPAKKPRQAARKAVKSEAVSPSGSSTAVGQVHVCQQCNKDFSTRTNLLRHIHTHDGSKPYKCTLCDSAFTQNGSLKQHMHIHTGQRPYECEFCGRGFTQSKSLTFHMRRHTGEKPYQCVECGLSFRQKDGLKRHASVRHPDGTARSREFPCDICKKVLKSRYSLNLHRRRHEDQSLRDEEEGRLMTSSPPGSALVVFSCEQCTRTFSTQASLVAHRRQHLAAGKLAAAVAANGGRAKVPDHQCPQCGEPCSNRGALNSHMKLVHREGAVLDEVLGDVAVEVQKPYECRVCGQRFALEVHRGVHMKAVHGKRCKQFACTRCNKAYAIQVNLLAHMARHEADDLAGGGDPIDTTFGSEATNNIKAERSNDALLDDDDDDDEFEDEEYADEDDDDEDMVDADQAMEAESVLGAADGHQPDRDGRSTQQIFECADCNMGFTQPEALRQHRRIEHGVEAEAEETCMCEECDTLFVDMAELEAHIVEVHGEQMPDEDAETVAKGKSGAAKKADGASKVAAWKCDRCDEEFGGQKALDEHQLEHDLTDAK